MRIDTRCGKDRANTSLRIFSIELKRFEMKSSTHLLEVREEGELLVRHESFEGGELIGQYVPSSCADGKNDEKVSETEDAGQKDKGVRE